MVLEILLKQLNVVELSAQEVMNLCQDNLHLERLVFAILIIRRTRLYLHQTSMYTTLAAHLNCIPIGFLRENICFIVSYARIETNCFVDYEASKSYLANRAGSILQDYFSPAIEALLLAFINTTMSDLEKRFQSSYWLARFTFNKLQYCPGELGSNTSK